MLMPKFVAYASPNKMAFSGFISKRARKSPMMQRLAKMGICCMDTLLKLPIPQMRKLWIFSTEAKKLSKEMTDEVI